jgi:hypothetical protein
MMSGNHEYLEAVRREAAERTRARLERDDRDQAELRRDFLQASQSIANDFARAHGIDPAEVQLMPREQSWTYLDAHQPPHAES